MQSAATQIVQQLDGLSPGDLAAVAQQALARASLLGAAPAGSAPAKANRANPDEALIYEAMSDVLRNYVGEVPSYGAFAKRHLKYKAFAEGAEALYQLVRKHLEPKNRPEKLKAYQYFCGMLVRRRVGLCRKRGTKVRPVDAYSFCDDLVRVRTIVEEQFPDYMPHGLLRILMKRQLAAVA